LERTQGPPPNDFAWAIGRLGSHALYTRRVLWEVFGLDDPSDDACRALAGVRPEIAIRNHESPNLCQHLRLPFWRHHHDGKRFGASDDFLSPGQKVRQNDLRGDVRLVLFCDEFGQAPAELESGFNHEKVAHDEHCTPSRCSHRHDFGTTFAWKNPSGGFRLGPHCDFDRGFDQDDRHMKINPCRHNESIWWQVFSSVVDPYSANKTDASLDQKTSADVIRRWEFQNQSS